MKSRRTTLSSVALDFCRWGKTGNRPVGKMQALRAFREELTKTKKGKRSLLNDLKRKGWKGRALSPLHLKMIKEKLAP